MQMNKIIIKISGQAGVGKSFVSQEIKNHFESFGFRVLIVNSDIRPEAVEKRAMHQIATLQKLAPLTEIKIVEEQLGREINAEESFI